MTSITQTAGKLNFLAVLIVTNTVIPDVSEPFAV